MIHHPSNEPNDEPEGAALVLMSATLLKEWATQRGVEIVKWGEPKRYEGDYYEPTLVGPIHRPKEEL